jgi:hypothetical protein
MAASVTNNISVIMEQFWQRAMQQKVKSNNSKMADRNVEMMQKFYNKINLSLFTA